MGVPGFGVCSILNLSALFWRFLFLIPLSALLAKSLSKSFGCMDLDFCKEKNPSIYDY